MAEDAVAETPGGTAFVKVAIPDAPLVTEPRSIVKGRRPAVVAAVFGVGRSAVGDGCRGVLPSAPTYRSRGNVRVWPSYANDLTVNGRVLVSSYRDTERDRGARRAPEGDARLRHHRDRRQPRGQRGRTVHCLTMQIPADVIGY